MHVSRAIIAVVLSLFGSVQGARGLSPSGACDLPQPLKREIANRYRGRDLVNISDLGEDHRSYYRKDHGEGCPGLSKVDFYGDGKPTLALVLIAGSGTKMKAELVVAHLVDGSWRTRVLDTAEGAPVPVVWRQPPGMYRDVYGNKVIRATRPVIVFTGYDSWSVLYAWTGSRVEKVWLQD